MKVGGALLVIASCSSGSQSGSGSGSAARPAPPPSVPSPLPAGPLSAALAPLDRAQLRTLTYADRSS
jgi:hypothetical protein